MTTIVRHSSPFLDWTRWIVNGCVEATMTRAEIVSLRDYKAEAVQRVTPLIWLAMPGHEDSRASL